MQKSRSKVPIGETGVSCLPRDGRDQATIWRCGGLESLYCSAWGCETNFHAAGTLSYSLVTFDIWIPCFNKLIAFIRERVSAVQILMLRQQYRDSEDLRGKIEEEGPEF